MNSKFLFIFVLLCIFTSSLVSADLLTNMVAYFKFDTVETGANSSTNAYHGNMTGSIINTTHYKGGTGSLGLDGSASYVTLAKATAIQNACNFSFAAWIKDFRSCDSNICTILGLGDNPGVGANEFWFSSGGAGWTYGAFTIDGSELSHGFQNITLANGQWHYIIFIHNQSGMQETYIDNELKKATAATGCVTPGAYPIGIGAALGTVSYNAQGLIDEFAFWNRTLNRAEITELWNGGAGKFDLFANNTPIATYKDPTPASGYTTNNGSVILNISCTNGGTSEIYFDWVNPPTKVIAVNKSTNLVGYLANGSNYYYYGKCVGGTSTATRTLFYDPYTPSISVYSGNFFNENNGSNVSRISPMKNFSLQFTDNLKIFAYEINITNGTHQMFYNKSESFTPSSFNVTLTSNLWCEQQFANVSTSCGGLDSGKGGYNVTGNYNPGLENAIDGNWSSYYQPTGETTLYMNFTRLSVSAYFEARNNLTWANYTIPDRCLNSTNITIKVRIKNDGVLTTQNAIEYYCAAANGVYYDALYTQDGLDLDYQFYEAKIHWNLPNITTYSYFNLSSLQVNLSNWTINKNYYVSIGTSDSHTAKEISDYDIRMKSSAVRYITEHNVNIEITSLDNSVTSTQKYSDRYRFSFDFGTKFYSEKKFKVNSTKKIYYVQDSVYKGHFVIFGEGIKGNWLDFEGKYDVSITKESDYIYYVSIWTDDKKINFDSIGGLNTLYKNYQFYLTSFYPVNLNVWLGDSKSTYSNEFTNTTNVTLHNETYINAILAGNCSCTGCSIVNNNCRIPLIFYNDINSTIRAILVNATWFNDINNCSINPGIDSNATALNITFYDNASNRIEVDYEAFTNFSYGNYSLTINTHNNLSYCVYPKWANIVTQTHILYTSGGTNFNYYYDAQLNNVTKILNLYTTGGTTLVLFRVTDLNDVGLANYKIHILRFDVGTATYTISEILQTDSLGYAVGNIILNTQYYNFMIYSGANVLVHSELGVILTATTRTFRISGDVDEWYVNFGTTLGVSNSLYYNNATRNFVFTWSDATGQMHNACLRIIESNYLGQTTLSDVCTLSTSGTMLYNLANATNGSRYIAQSYLKYDDEFPLYQIDVWINEAKLFFQQDKNNSLFIAVILLIVGMLLGLPNPAFSMIYYILVMIISFAIGLYDISLTMLGSVVITGFVLMYIGSRQ